MSHRTAIAVLCYVLVGFILRATHGTYHSTLVWTLGGALGIVGYLLAPRREEFALSPRTSPQFVFAAVLAASGWMLWLDPLLITAIPSPASIAVNNGLLALALAASGLAILYYDGRRPSRVASVGLIASAWVLLAAVRCAALAATPLPNIDVFVTNTMACDYFLAGENPYAAWYPDIYEGAKDYAPGFFYWPAYLYFAAPFRALLGDVRLAAAAADIGTALLLAVIGRRLGLSAASAWLAPLVWLASPVSLMVLELGWIDPVLVFGSTAIAAAMAFRRPLAIGICVGLVAGTKQYGVLVGLLALAAVWGSDRRAFRRVALAAAATFLALLVPWAVADWQSLYESTIATYIAAPVRLDALSLVVWAKRALGVTVPAGLLGLAYAALVTACVWRLAKGRWDRTEQCLGHSASGARLIDWSAASAVAYGGIFLFGKLAFCNYYHFVSFFVVLLAVVSLADDRRRLAAAAPVETEASATAKGVVAWSV